MDLSGNDIRQEVILDLRDPVFQGEFFLFQPAQLQLVGTAGGYQRINCNIQVAMVLLQFVQQGHHTVLAWPVAHVKLLPFVCVAGCIFPGIRRLLQGFIA